MQRIVHTSDLPYLARFEILYLVYFLLNMAFLLYLLLDVFIW